MNDMHTNKCRIYNPVKNGSCALFDDLAVVYVVISGVGFVAVLMLDRSSLNTLQEPEDTRK